VPVTPHRVAMRGTDARMPRCVALDGEIGLAVRCTIYERRASPCRDFPFSYADGERNERCDQARKSHGLPPLSRPDGSAEEMATVATDFPPGFLAGQAAQEALPDGGDRELQ